MTALEDTWGTTGLLLEGAQTHGAPARGAPAAAPNVAASIHFAPASAVPRLRDLPFEPPPADAVLVFCLACAEGQPRYQPKRILHKVLRSLKDREVNHVYAVASAGPPNAGAAALAAWRPPAGSRLPGPPDGDHCRFFPADFLWENGFEQVGEGAGLLLMHLDLGGTLSVVARIRAAIIQFLGDEPTPSPAAWTRHAGC